MISSLEQLAKESSLFREVAKGNTSYHAEVEHLDSLYHGKGLTFCVTSIFAWQKRKLTTV